MNLKEQIDEILFDAGIEEAPEPIINMIDNLALDFLEWVFDNFTTPKDCPYSIPELWEQFKIERNL